MISLFFKNKYKLQLKLGFTMIEMLVAITILLVGVLGPLSIASQGIAEGLFVKNQITAVYLAQEAIELMVNKQRNLKNYNSGHALLTPIPDFYWLEGICVNSSNVTVHPTPGGILCAADVYNDSVIWSNSVDNRFNLQFCDNPGLYLPLSQPCSGNRIGTVFTRKVKIYQDGAAVDKAKVEVEMEWQDKTTVKSFKLVRQLYDLTIHI